MLIKKNGLHVFPSLCLLFFNYRNKYRAVDLFLSYDSTQIFWYRRIPIAKQGLSLLLEY